MSNTPAVHPRILIQSDWFISLRDNALPVDVWLEYKAGSTSIARLAQNVHGVVSIKSLANQEATVYRTSASDYFQSADIDKKLLQLRIKVKDSEFVHTFQGPKKSFRTSGKDEDDVSDTNPLVNVPELRKNQTQNAQTFAHPHWFDISSGGVGLTAFSSGKITIWDLENGEVRRKLKGHVENVYVSRFFPSDFAVVSGGADMRVKVWSLDSSNDQVRDTTLTGHRSRINDVLALDQKRVLSASNDSSVLMWDVTKSEPLQTIAELDKTAVANMCSFDSSLACACDDGSLRLYDLKSADSKKPTAEIKIGTAASAVCYLSESNQLVCGTEQSVIGIYDIRQLNNVPVHIWKEQRGKINSLVPSRDGGGILGTTSDGSCFEYNKEEVKNMADLANFHVIDYTDANEAVLNAKVFNNKIYSVCHDGLVRVYDNNNE